MVAWVYKPEDINISTLQGEGGIFLKLWRWVPFCEASSLEHWHTAFLGYDHTKSEDGSKWDMTWSHSLVHEHPSNQQKLVGGQDSWYLMIPRLEFEALR